jgi:2-polyprenyl-6-methoxyphenol hydroxylase-like FAD-dependent oxidoreductase
MDAGATERIEGVAISGAGPVGLVTALCLAQSGIPVTLFDSSPEINPSPRAIVYHSPTVQALDSLGLFDDLKAVGVLKKDYQWRALDGRILGAVDMAVLKPEDTDYPFNLHLGQHKLAEIVMKHLLRIPGADIRWNHRVAAVKPNGDDVTITLDTPEGAKMVTADWLVGADGASSGVRQALNLAFDGITWPDWFVATNIVYDFEKHGYAKANFVIDPDHWAIIPKINNDGLWRLTYGEPGSIPREALRDRLEAKLAHLLPGGEKTLPEAFSPYRVHNRCTENFRIGRVLLAGDAAHVTNPVGGLGLTGGILDAVALGNALSAVIHGDAKPNLLDHYAEDRRRIFTDIVSPVTADNKRRLAESNPDKARADLARFERLTNEPAFAREMLLSTFKLVGSPKLSASIRRKRGVPISG